MTSAFRTSLFGIALLVASTVSAHQGPERLASLSIQPADPLQSNEFEREEERLQRAIEMDRRENNLAAAFDHHVMLGKLRERKGLFTDAGNAYTEALDLTDELQTGAGAVADVLSSLGTVRLMQNMDVEAEKILNRALSLRKAAAHSLPRLRDLAVLSMAQNRQGHFDAARKSAQQVVDLYDKHNFEDDGTLDLAHRVLGQVDHAQKNYAQALKHFQVARDIEENIKASPQVQLLTRFAVALMFYEQQNLVLARNELKGLEAQVGRSPAIEDQVLLVALRATTARNLGRPEEASQGLRWVSWICTDQDDFTLRKSCRLAEDFGWMLTAPHKVQPSSDLWLQRVSISPLY